MNFIDLHCDTASLMLERNQPLLQNNLQIDIKKLQKGEAMAQFFAIYIDKEAHLSSYDYSLEMIENFKKELLLNKNSTLLCRDSNDLKIAEKSKRIGAFLTIEEGDVLEGNLDRLDFFKEQGISAITLTWNYENDLGYPNFEWKYQKKGLKKRGFEAVEKMNSLKILIDVSHLSDAGFQDVLNHSKTPFLATHSNSRAITNHSRNLSDTMLKQLANAGGVAGLAFAVNFLEEQDKIDESRLAKIENMVQHIKHIRNIAGVEVLALGSDFDGITNPVEISDSSQMGKLSDALLKNGFSYDEVERIFFKNTLRIIKDVLG